MRIKNPIGRTAWVNYAPLLDDDGVQVGQVIASRRSRGRVSYFFHPDDIGVKRGFKYAGGWTQRELLADIARVKAGIPAAPPLEEQTR